MKIQLRRALFALVVSLITVQSFVACSAEATLEPVRVPSESIVISFATSEWARSEYEQLAEVFHKSHPHITVEVLSYQTLNVNVEGEGAIRTLAGAVDTFVCPTDLLPNHSRQGIVRDLTPLIESDPHFVPDDFYPGLLEAFQWDGGTWGLPAHANFNLIFYDKTAFEEAGITSPHLGWSYADFTQAAQQLTVQDGDRTIRYGFINPLSYITDLLIFGRAGMWADESGTLPLPKLDDPAMVEAVQWYADQVKRGVIANPVEFNVQELNALVHNGKAAMWAGHTRQFQAYSHLSPGVASLPEGKAIVGWKWDTGYGMSAGTTHPQESWQWLSFLTHQAVTRMLNAGPARRSVAETSAYWDRLDEQLGQETAATYRYILEKPESSIPWEMPLSAPLRVALETVLTGEQEVSEALAAAQTQAMAAMGELDESALTPAPTIVVPTPEPESDNVVITFYHDGNIGPYYSLAERFHEEHPEIKVDLVEPTEWGIPHWAEVCDCFAVYAPVSDDQYFLNLEPFVDADQDFSLDDFYPQSIEAFRQQGNLLGLPVDIDLLVVQYNKNLFDEASVEYPQPGWDLDDFLEKAMALTKGEGKDRVYGYVPLFPAIDVNFFLAQKGATLLDVEHPSRPALDSSVTVEAMRWYADLALVYGVMPIVQVKEYRQEFSEALMKRLTLVHTDRAAMWAVHTNADFGQALESFSIGTAPLPLDREKMQMSHHNLVGYVISARSAHPRACWEWIKFLSDHSSLVVRGRPARRSIAESPIYRSQVGEEAAEVFSFTMEHLDPALDVVKGDSPLNMLYYWRWETYDRILEGANVENALANAQTKAEAFVDCLGKDIASASRSQYWACAQEVDPEVEIPPDLRQE
jgi:multiple sugar transport system substrate-binding protein